MLNFADQIPKRLYSCVYESANFTFQIGKKFPHIRSSMLKQVLLLNIELSLLNKFLLGLGPLSWASTELTKSGDLVSNLKFCKWYNWKRHLSHLCSGNRDWQKIEKKCSWQASSHNNKDEVATEQIDKYPWWHISNETFYTSKDAVNDAY